MYIIKVVNAYAALLALMDQELPYKDACKIATLKRKLQPHAEFFSKKESELVKTYAETNEKGIVWTGKGKFRLRPGAEEEYTRRRLELCAVEVEEEFQEIEIQMPEKIRPIHIEALEGFVKFREG